MNPLGNMVQLSSVKSIVVEDINDDGDLDLILAGNTIYTEVETPRIDGSYGMVMHDDGDGGFISIHPSESNFYLTGEIPNMSTIKTGPKQESGILTIQNNGYLNIFNIFNL